MLGELFVALGGERREQAALVGEVVSDGRVGNAERARQGPQTQSLDAYLGCLGRGRVKHRASQVAVVVRHGLQHTGPTSGYVTYPASGK